MASLAIKGHPTKGNEVIEIFKMLGGRNDGYSGLGFQFYYYIDECSNIFGTTELPNSKTFIIYTLEEFLEKFPYKVGDKVIYEDKVREVTKMVWEEQTNTVAYKLDDKLYCNVIKELQLCKEETMEELRIEFPEGYGYASIENKQVIFIKIKPQYQKTYEECCTILNLPHNELTIDVPLHYSPTLIYLTKLLLCRDAYWKIAGEQMGLDGPWEPNWENERYSIYRYENNKIIKGLDCTRCINRHILEFPTEEMRDAFYENFKDLIEQCKELL